MLKDSWRMLEKLTAKLRSWKLQFSVLCDLRKKGKQSRALRSLEKFKNSNNFNDFLTFEIQSQDQVHFSTAPARFVNIKFWSEENNKRNRSSKWKNTI